MLLVIDIGNTNVVTGLFQQDKLVATWRMATQVHKTSDEYMVLLASFFSYRGLGARDVQSVVIASVVPPLIPVFEDVCRRYLQQTPLVVGPGIRTGVRILYENPKEVGADRIANALAAYKLHGGPAIIIDFGTATTFDAISREGDYLGGAIAPGIEIASEALFEHTAKLPRVELSRPKQAIGRNTVASMQSGILFGYVGLVEGMVARIKQELGGTAKVLATGGLADIVARESRVIEVVDHHITLIGLRLMHELQEHRT
ncbi:MAG: type III pantothenate kinase [Chloroflexota bacterium]|nr:MAG: type III pantothenate kinase [Chloroflexota bacterium]